MNKCENCYNMECVFVDNQIPFFDSENCQNYRGMTNADKIRTMSDEELAEWLIRVQYREGDICAPTHDVQNCRYAEGCKACWLEWLKEEARK